jgi:integrase/recombinase XerC/integrase/recombinase XerD
MNSGFFSEWLKSYRTYLLMRNYSPRTVESYEQVIKHFAYYVWLRRHTEVTKLVIYWKDFENARLDTGVEVPPVMITDFLSFMSSMRTYKAKTFHRMISTLSSFYRFLYTQEAVTANPMMGIERPRIKQQEIRYLKHSQVLRLIDAIEDPRDKLIVRTIYATGVRVSELCSINIEDIDFEEHTIRIKGKGDKIRIVFLDDETLGAIRTFIGIAVEGPLFVGQQGKHISPRAIQHLFRHYAPAGITPHKIRHSYATELYRRSKNLRVVQENLGHTSIKTTEIYLHTDIDERRQVYQQFFPLSNGPDTPGPT